MLHKQSHLFYFFLVQSLQSQHGATPVAHQPQVLASGAASATTLPSICQSPIITVPALSYYSHTSTASPGFSCQSQPQHCHPHVSHQSLQSQHWATSVAHQPQVLASASSLSHNTAIHMSATNPNTHFYSWQIIIAWLTACYFSLWNRLHCHRTKNFVIHIWPDL
jgi:hypothetical protein